ncbi:tetratricopeptide repeat protein [Aureliella helgolandensis]|uniref:Tetratricopeptide repeat protein n=1 Tax=Aureliella helgolandensis TaxID=2527968 RepID=A0A518G2F3_9BACT|nr:CDC27 family protein [Aureliella helgolandensis]QDV22786.1 hypothetical protein Q31a_10770 [Aureliella helgolandensis]
MNSRLPTRLNSAAFPVGPLLCLAALLCAGFTTGCYARRGNNAERLAQQIEEGKTKNDHLRKALRHLVQMTPVNRENYIPEVQLELNTWLKDADTTSSQYAPSPLLQSIPADRLEAVGCSHPVNLNFSYWDVEYLFERHLMQQLAKWVIAFPMRDNLLQPVLEKERSHQTPAEALQLEEAYKLFDWTIRNIALTPDREPSEDLLENPTSLSGDRVLGCDYLPWETVLYSSGDFVERGRVFTALADQRGIDTFWVANEAAGAAAGKLWTIGVLIGKDVYLFEPSLGMPILDPDAETLATLAAAQTNDRILRRLDLPGQFDYPLDAGELKSIKLFMDVVPAAGSARMKILEGQLLGEERMVLFEDLDALQSRISAAVPDAPVEIWQAPLLAQLRAAEVREMLKTTSPAMMNYLNQHGVWLMDNPAARGRLAHLWGEFENTNEKRGALALYMDNRIDDDSLRKLLNDPDVQRELGVPRAPGEPMEQYQMRVLQAQAVLGLAKVDTAFLLAQLHFDRGNYEAAENFLRKRVLEDGRAQKWHAAGWYLLGRIEQELGRLPEATEALTHQPSPQEPGNRLRLRYLKREASN